MAARGPTLQESDVLASLGFGHSDMRATIPNDPNSTRFPIASNTKVMTAVLIFMLQERGVLNITDDVSNYLNQTDFNNWGLPSMTKFCFSLPSDPSKACQKITFEMLMGMTSGITGPTPQVLLGFAPMYVNIATMFGLQFPLMFLAFQPGTQYLYANQNFMLLGYFIEKYTGMELAAAYKKFIFDPLGMKDSYFDRLNGLLTFDPLRTQEGFRYFMVDQETEVLGDPIGVGKCEIDADTGTAQGAGGVVSILKDEAILYYCLFDMSYGDDAPNPHCPFNSSLAHSPSNAFNILSFASRKKIIAPHAYVAEPPYDVSLAGTTYYAMGMGVSNKTGPYPDDVDAAIAVRGPPSSYYAGPPLSVDPLTFPDFVLYIGAFYCVNTANFLAVSNRTVGGVAFMTQAFEAHRAMSTTNPDAVIATRTDEQVSFYTFPSDVVAAYTAASISAAIAQYILAPTPAPSTTPTTDASTTATTATTGSTLPSDTPSSVTQTGTLTDAISTTQTSQSTTPNTSPTPTPTITSGSTTTSNSATSTQAPTATPSSDVPTTSIAATTITTTEQDVTSTTTQGTVLTSSIETSSPSSPNSSSTTLTSSATPTTITPIPTTVPPAQSLVFDTDLPEYQFVQTIRNAIPYGSPMELMWCKNSTTNSSRMSCEVAFWNATAAEIVLQAANEHRLPGIYSAATVGPNNSAPRDDSPPTTGIIVGVVVGAVMLAVVVGVIVHLVKKKRSSNERGQLMEPMGELNSDVTIFS